MLPLSGPFARFGEESLQGILLAAGIFGGAAPPGAGPGVKLLIRDTAGRPELAAEAVRELAADPEVSAIVGPLLSGESEAAAAAAEAAGVPLLALSSREEIAHGRSFVFRLRTTPQEEIATLVEHTRPRARRAALRDPLSARSLRPRRAQALLGSRRAGGRPRGRRSRPTTPRRTDFADPIRQLLGFSLLSADDEAVLAQRANLEQPRAAAAPPGGGEAARGGEGADAAPAARRCRRSSISTCSSSPSPTRRSC